MKTKRASHEAVSNIQWGRLLILLSFFHFSGLNNGFALLSSCPIGVESIRGAGLGPAIASVLSDELRVRAGSLLDFGFWSQNFIRPSLEIESVSRRWAQSLFSRENAAAGWRAVIVSTRRCEETFRSRLASLSRGSAAPGRSYISNASGSDLKFYQPSYKDMRLRYLLASNWSLAGETVLSSGIAAQKQISRMKTSSPPSTRGMRDRLARFHARGLCASEDPADFHFSFERSSIPSSRRSIRDDFFLRRLA